MGTGVVDPLIGQLVDDRYQVTVRIARGGMATVYRATDRRLDREVAVKVMHPHLTEGADFVARFRREARAAARLVHPGVVSVFDQGTADGGPYLVMEFVDGPNLRAHLRAAGSLPLGEALSVVAQVLDALALAHKQGVVHRDIKPENVLIAPNGRIKVADFGLARAMSEVTMATTGVVLGTAAYLAPEVVQRGLADARSDVYACGILLYELLTGQRPFDGETAMAVAYKHIHEDVPPPSALEEWLPSEVDDLVLAMTRRNPDERPADAAAALAMVRRVQRALGPDLLDQRATKTAVLDPALLPDAPEDFRDVEALFADPEKTEVLSAAEVAAVTGGSTVALPVGHDVFELGDPVAGDDEPVALRARQHANARKRHVGLVVAAIALVVVLLTGGVVAGWYFLAGPGSTTIVPGVVGLAENTAVQHLRDQGLTSSVSRKFSDVVPEGVVIAANPAAGERIDKNGRVALVVSRGIEMKTVPKVVGKTENEAVSALKQADLTNGNSTYVYSQDVSLGFVISSNPKAGASIPHNKPVLLTVSKGPQPVTMPSVVGLSADAAAGQVGDLGLTATVTQETSKQAAAGTVISQSPKKGTTLHRGDNVAYVVSLGPPQVTVPSVAEQSADQAKATLEGLGFTVKITKPQKISPLNRVYEQSPAAGQQVDEGSTITLSVF